MFSAIWRYFRAFGYLITGRIDAARMALSANPYVVQATYDNIIAEKRKRIQQYKEAVAGMIAQEEKKKAELQGAVRGDGQAEEPPRRRGGDGQEGRRAARRRRRGRQERSGVSQVPGGLQGLQLHPAGKGVPLQPNWRPTSRPWSRTSPGTRSNSSRCSASWTRSARRSTRPWPT